MQNLSVQLGKRVLKLKLEDGDDGFIEINDPHGPLSVHIRDEDGELVLLHFGSGADPVDQLQLTGSVT